MTAALLLAAHRYLASGRPQVRPPTEDTLAPAAWPVRAAGSLYFELGRTTAMTVGRLPSNSPLAWLARCR